MTQIDSEQWCLRNSFPVSEKNDTPDLSLATFMEGKFSSASDAGKRIALCRMLLESIWSQEPQCLLWITQWSIWPSGEHFPLFKSVRHSYGEDRSIMDAPGHLFHIGEFDDALTFFVLSCLFLWDASLLIAGGKIALGISHDEYGVLYTMQVDKRDELNRRFSKFGLSFKILS